MPPEDSIFLNPTPTLKKIGEGIFEGVKPLKQEKKVNILEIIRKEQVRELRREKVFAAKLRKKLR